MPIGDDNTWKYKFYLQQFLSCSLFVILLFIVASITLLETSVHAFADTSVTTKKPLVLILESKASPPYSITANAFNSAISSETVQIERYTLKNVSAIKTKIHNSDYAIIYALGSHALKYAQNHRGDNTKVLGALVLNGATDINPKNIGVLALLHSPITQLKWLHKLLPDAKRIGIIYSAQNIKNIEKATITAHDLGVELLARLINTPQELPDALDRILRHSDVLWGISDSMVLQSSTAKALLLASFRNRVPMIGPSSTWTKAGAIYSLGWDYVDIGEQSAQIVISLLKGKKMQDLTPAWPRKVLYTLNLKTARHMRMEFEEGIIKGAKKVYP
ncbi:MAG: ABC transporter substrate binding protein [Mariprofundales bacterium]